MSPSTWRAIYLIISINLLASVASTQLLNFASGELPACARNCQLLQQAQTVCVPPAAPATGQQAYQACFCQSAYLVTLRQSPAGVCDATCTSPTDAQQIQKWYVNLCNTGKGAAGATATVANGAATSAGAANGNGVAATPANAAAATSTADSFQGTNINAGKQSWWSEHGRWIAMIIVLVIAFIIIIVVGVIWKRRYNRKRNRATATPLPSSGWGPNLNPHSYPGPVEKGSGSYPTRQPSGKLSRGTRLKKLVGR